MSVRRVSDVKKYLEHYVENELFQGKAVPSRTRRRYFPRKKDIANEISKIKRAKRFTQIDQDYLHHLISKWSLQKPEDKFFFRPHSTQRDTDLTDTVNTTFENDGLDDDINDDIDEIRPKQTPKSQNNLLFCYQSEQQQRLLARYGSICLLDATYRSNHTICPSPLLPLRQNQCWLSGGWSFHGATRRY